MAKQDENKERIPLFVELLEYRRTKGAGARATLDIEKVEFAAELIAAGCIVKDAALLIGTSERTWYRWKAKGDELLRYLENCERGGINPVLREDDELYIEFADRINAALPYRKLALRKIIEKHSDRNWTAAAWMLERQYPDEYSRRVQVEHNLDNRLIQLIQQGEVTYELLTEEMDDEEARRLFNAARVEIPAESTSGKSNQES